MKTDGGPAFPQIDSLAIKPEGMSLRAYFAGQALVGFQSFVTAGWAGRMPHSISDNIAVNCVRIADALISELEKPRD